MSYVEEYLAEAREILNRLDIANLQAMIAGLIQLRKQGGRLFVLGVGGGAGHASHAVNDFRKICGIESYAPTDNVSELTARINDDGWESTFASWLLVSKLSADDALFIFSVGGGNEEKKVSVNLVEALKLAGRVGAKIFGIVGRDGGYTAQVATACVIIPPISPATITPHTEAFQAVVWHLIVAHPSLQAAPMKWESLDASGGGVSKTN